MSKGRLGAGRGIAPVARRKPPPQCSILYSDQAKSLGRRRRPGQAAIAACENPLDILGSELASSNFDESAHNVSDHVMQEATALDFVNQQDRKSTRLNSSHLVISYAVFCLKKKKKQS